MMMMMMKARWLEKASERRNSNANISKNNYKIGVIRSCLNNMIMPGSVCYVLVVVLMFSCFECVMAKSLDIPEAESADTLDRLAPPDHLEGIRMEQDGHLNKKFHKEVFLGDLEDFEDIPYEERKSKLDEVFNKADTNNDEILELSEIESWIEKKLQEHFHEAAGENERIFQTLDKNKDGFLAWDEYLHMYLLARGYGKDKVEKYMKENTTNDHEKENFILSQREEQFFQNGDKDILMRYKNRWELSDTDKMDNKLTKNEFLNFRHPELKPSSMDDMAKSILDGLDKNNDGNLTIEEFVVIPPGISSDVNTVEEDRKWQNERRKEFNESIDLNKDGMVNLKELKSYLDPRNPIQIKNEATAILEMIDDDYNGKLSKEEVQRHETEFIYSKMVETGKSFHDEF